VKNLESVTQIVTNEIIKQSLT